MPAGRGRPIGSTKVNGNRNGQSAMHPQMGMTWKRALKIEAIARLSANPAGYSNAQIANMLNCTEQTIVLIRQTPAYHAKMIEVATTVVTSMHDKHLRTSVENMREELRDMVPSSMMVIRNALAGQYGTNIQFKAAQEVLDREGTNAKVSKSSVSIENKTDLSINPQVAANLMALLSSAPVTTDAQIVSGGFTQRADDALSQQKNMSNSDTTKLILEAIDLSDKTPN